MKLVLGNKIKNIEGQEFLGLIKEFDKKIVDLGTGDGKYVLRNGLKNPNRLYIGIDPIKKQMQASSRKVARKKLPNVLFIVASAENLPWELNEIVDEVKIIFPWGSLLNYVANCDLEKIQKIRNLLKKDGTLEIVFGYTKDKEPVETGRLGLEILSEDYLKDFLVPKYKQAGFSLLKMEKLEKKEFPDIGSSWSKRLDFGSKRPVFRLVLGSSSFEKS